MDRKAIHTDRAPRAIGPYSQAVRAGNLVFCSGQIPLDPETGELVHKEDVAGQTRQVMTNLRAVLKAAGADFGNAVRATIYLMNLDDFGAVNEVYGEFFESAPPPARACIEVAKLPRGALVEIDLIAAV